MAWLIGTVLAFLILLLLYLILPDEWRRQTLQEMAHLPRRLFLAVRSLVPRLSRAAKARRRPPPNPPLREWQEGLAAAEEERSSWQERVRNRLAPLLRAPPAERDAAPVPASSPPKKRSSQEVRLSLILAIVVLLGGALLLATILEGRFPTRRSHHLTVAIVDLGVGEDVASSREGARASEDLRSHLEQSLQEAGLADLVGLRMVHETPADAEAAHELALRHRADLLLWGTLQGQSPPRYVLQLALAPRIDKEVPEFEEYFQCMMAPPNAPLTRTGSETGLSREDAAAALIWLARFYLGQFDRIEGLSPEVNGHPALAPELFTLHRGSLLWLKGDYDQAAVTLDGLIGARYSVSFGNPPPTCSERTDPLLCTAAFNNKAVVLLTQEALGKQPPLVIDEAISLLRSAVQQDPQSVVARYNLGRAYVVRREWNNAIETLLPAHELEPDFVPVLTVLSEAYREKGSLRFAKEAANRAVARDAGSATARLALGQCLLSEGNTRKARRTLEQALEMAEAEAKQRRSRESALSEGPEADTKRAVFTVAWARRSNPVLAQIHLAQAELFLVLGEEEGKPSFFVFLWRTVTGEQGPLELAMQEVDHALSIRPNWYDALFLRGEIHLARGALDHAVDSFEAAKAQDPGDERAYLTLADALREQWATLRSEGKAEEAQQKLDQARAQYNLLVEQDIAPARGYFGLGEIAQESGELENAHWAYSQVVQIDPTRSDAYLRLGQVERKIGDELQALHYFDLCLQNAGEGTWTRALAHTEKGEIFLEQYLREKTPSAQEHLEKARTQFEQTLATHRNILRALNGLGRVAYEEGNDKEAERLFREALRKNRNSFGALYGMGRVHESRGDSRAALSSLARAVQVDGGDISARYHLGVAYYAQLQEDRARQTFQQVVDMCAQQPEGKRLKADDVESCQMAAQRLETLSNAP